jgi:hypothetical protein
MKFTIMLKDADGVYESLKEAGVINDDGTPKDEEAAKFVDQFLEFDESVYIEFNTVSGTVRVIPVNE